MNHEAYVAFAQGCAVVDVSDRGQISTSGEDRARLLHAMTTNHVQALTPGQGLYAFFLNAQGRIQSDVLVYCRPGELILDVEPGSRAKVYDHLDHYIIADDVIVQDRSDEWFALDVSGPKSAGILAHLAGPQPEADYENAAWDNKLVIRTTATGAPGYRILGPLEEKPPLLEALTGAGAILADAATAEVIRLEHHRPRYGVDITDANIPQETSMMQAIHFNKGCYLGQEIVERVRSRGHVNRSLMTFSISGESAPPPLTKLLADGKEVGALTSAVYSPNRGHVIALGFVRAEHQKPGTVLTLSTGGEAIVLPATP